MRIVAAIGVGLWAHAEHGLMSQALYLVAAVIVGMGLARLFETKN